MRLEDCLAIATEIVERYDGGHHESTPAVTTRYPGGVTAGDLPLGQGDDRLQLGGSAAACEPASPHNALVDSSVQLTSAGAPERGQRASKLQHESGAGTR